MQTGLQLDRKSQQWSHNLLDSKSAGEEPEDQEPSTNSATLSHTQENKHPAGMCKRDITHKAGGKPLQRAPHAALSTHAVGEAAGVRAAKGKAARGPENILQGKSERAGTSQHRLRWLDREETGAVVFRCVQKLLFQATEAPASSSG